jgi:hypothetical protein
MSVSKNFPEHADGTASAVPKQKARKIKGFLVFVVVAFRYCVQS